MTIREALVKAMKTRNLSPSNCTIFTEHPRMIIDWDTDTSQLDGKEVTHPLLIKNHMYSICINFFICLIIFIILYLTVTLLHHCRN